MSKIKLSYQDGKGFKKSVGKHVGRDGTLKPKMWWLGEYEEPAQKIAGLIVQEWRGLKGQKIDHWPDDALERIDLARNGGQQAASPNAKPLIGKQHTTHQVLDLFRSHVMTSDKAESTKNTTYWQVNQLKGLVWDVPLASVGAIELRAMVDMIRSAELSESSKFNLVKLYRCTMDWCDRHEIWQAPRRFNDFFRCRWKRGSVIRTFDKLELKALWAAANRNQRLYLALMLNCGFTAIDIARLQYDPRKPISDDTQDYEDGITYVFPSPAWRKRDGDRAEWFKGWHVAGKRTKTNVFGSFPLWEETAELIAKRLHPGLAILNDEGKPLVSLKAEGARIDFVGQSLRKLISKVHKHGECQKFAVKCFRKTGSQLVRDVAGLEMSQLFLRHGAGSTAERHYNRGNFEQLAEAMLRVRSELAEVLANA